MSKGQRAKVALALATAHDPQLLILDEPTSGLDPMVRRQFLESMVDRAAQGRTVLLSSHHISEVERVANWVAILHEGRMKIVAPLDQLRSTTFNVTASLADTDVAIASPRGEILSEFQSGRQVRWIVRDLPDNWQADYHDDAGINAMHATSATLEEIFVAVCGEKQQGSQSMSRRNTK